MFDNRIHKSNIFPIVNIAPEEETSIFQSRKFNFREQVLFNLLSVQPQQPLEESSAHQPTPKRSQSAPHLIQVHHQKKHNSPMKQVLEEMESEDKFQDSTSVSKILDLLLKSEKFVQKVKTIQLAEK